jgi:AcrR family transcriptional regulator
VRTGVRSRRREETRRALLRESRSLFAAQGYAGVGLSQIVQRTGVTKGALYHHFAGKADLFRTVLEQVQLEVAQEVAAAAEAHTDPWAQLTAGCDAFLTASTSPGIQRIMLIDGPAVLGWHEWRAMDEATSARLLADVLTILVEAGTLPRQPVPPLVHLLSGAINEGALWVAASGDPNRLPDMRAALRRLLESLRAG